MILEILVGILFLAIVLNAWTTLRVLRDDLADPIHKMAHIPLAWIVPILGSLIFLHLLAIGAIGLAIALYRKRK